MQAALTMADVEIVNFNEINISLYQHSGSQSGLTQSIQRFIQWRKDNRLHPSRYRTFNLVYVDPKVTSDQDYLFGLASQVDSSDYALAENMSYSQIPAGRCAHVRHTGPDERLSHKVEFLYSHWLAATGNLPRDYPLFFERVSFFPEVSELEMITDIYLPIE